MNMMHSEVSRQWMSRPMDERYTNLDDLFDAVSERAQSSHYRVHRTSRLRTDHADEEMLLIADDHPYTMTNWSFGQLCRHVGAPAAYMKKIPVHLAAQCLNANLRDSTSGWGLSDIQLLGQELGQDHTDQMRALTSTSYTRIWDAEVVKLVQSVAGRGDGSQGWKVPGMIDYTGINGYGQYGHNPNVTVDQMSTTLYASDRDVFMFLVDDKNPVSVGRLPNGDDDLMFPGFYVFNSEVGSKTFGMATMWMRAVCCNRLLWGVEDFKEVRLKHTSNVRARMAPYARRFVDQTLDDYGTRALKLEQTSRKLRGQTILPPVKDEDDRRDQTVKFLSRVGLQKHEAVSVMNTYAHEPTGGNIETLWDASQAISAHARTIKHQDDRVAMERIAGKVLDDRLVA